MATGNSAHAFALENLYGLSSQAMGVSQASKIGSLDWLKGTKRTPIIVERHMGCWQTSVLFVTPGTRVTFPGTRFSAMRFLKFLVFEGLVVVSI